MRTITFWALFLICLPAMAMNDDDKVKQLFDAIESNKAEDVARLITGDNAVSPLARKLFIGNDVLPLSIALIYDHLDCAKVLLDHPSAAQQVRTRDTLQLLPLDFAIANVRLEMIPLLIAQGAVVTRDTIRQVREYKDFTQQQQKEILSLLDSAYGQRSVKGLLILS